MAQQEALSEIKRFSNQIPLPSHVRDDQDEEPAMSEQSPVLRLTSMDAGLLSPKSKNTSTARKEGAASDAVLHSTSEFYKWFSELEAAKASEAEEKYNRHSKTLERHIGVCNDLLKTIDEVLELFSSLKAGQKTISDRTDALRQTCDKLVSERESLVKVSDAVNERLKYFDQLEKLSAQFHGPLQGYSPEEILNGLSQLDASIKFTESHPEYLDSTKYHSKFKQLQGRAFSLVKSYFQETVMSAVVACKEAAETIGEEKRDGDSNMSIAEMTLQNVKFRAVMEPRVNKLMSGIQATADESDAYASLLHECAAIYSKARFELVRSNILGEIRKFSSSITPIEALKQGSQIILETAEIELQLYPQIFSESPRENDGDFLKPLFDSMCLLLSVVVEPLVYASQSNTLSSLCQLNSLVKGLMQDSSTSAVFDVPSINKMLGDIQQMIIEEAKNATRANIVSFTPNLQSVMMLDQNSMNMLDSMSLSASSRDIQEISDTIQEYEPLSQGIQLLEQIDPAVTKVEFNLIAREILHGVLESINKGAEICNDSKGEVYGSIFTLRNLILLKECVKSLGVDLNQAAAKSGLSQLGSSIRRGLTNRIPILSSFSGKGQSNKDINITEEMEKRMKVSKEFLAIACSQDIVNPILSFLTKVTAAKVSTEEKQVAIKTLAFASIDRATLLSQTISEALTSLLRSLLLVLILIPSSESSKIHDSIKDNVLEAYDQLSSIIGEEYTEEEREAIGLPCRSRIEHVFNLTSS